MQHFPQLRLFDANHLHDSIIAPSMLFSAKSDPAVCTERLTPVYSS